MEKTITLSDEEEIRRLVDEQVNIEHDKYASPKGCQDELNVSGDCQFASKEIINALNRNEDGDAWLYMELHRNKFCYDTAAGSWYVWSSHFWQEDVLNDAMRSIDAVVATYVMELERLSWEQQKEVLNGSGEN